MFVNESLQSLLCASHILFNFSEARIDSVDSTSDNHFDIHIVIDTILAALASHARVLNSAESNIICQYSLVSKNMKVLLTVQQSQR